MLLGLAWGCSASSADGNGQPASGGGTGIGEAGLTDQVLTPDGMAEGDGALHLNPLCGTTPQCVPDDFTACNSYVAPAPTEGAAGAAGNSFEASPAGGGGGVSSTSIGETGLGGSTSASLASGGGAGLASGGGAGLASGGGASLASDGGASLASDGGASLASDGGASLASDGGASGAGGANEQPEAAGAAGATAQPAPSFSCQVQRSTSSSQSVVSRCAVAGTGGSNAPCFTSSDCQAGYGCVGDQNGGFCQRYCCQDADACDPDTYCTARPLRDAVTNAQAAGSSESSSALMIPVCVPAQNCDLSTPYPCKSGTTCTCATGTACLVVRSDGTTTCAVPGKGQAADACPCAWGYVCSAATSQCLKLCYTRTANSCGDGQCQSSAELPDGWGVCIGTND